MIGFPTVTFLSVCLGYFLEAILDYDHGAIITADTGFANEANMQYLYEKDVDAYIPDNKFRSRDPAYQDQKTTHGKRHQDTKSSDYKEVIPATEFQFDPTSMTCVCPAGNELSFRGERETIDGTPKAYFEGKLLQCRNCDLKHQCMKNPGSANHRKGNGRQVSFILHHKQKPTYTDWMKERVDSDYGKIIYGHRMASVEPVFANIGTNKGLNRFSLRGKIKVQTQWLMHSMVHNVEKLFKYGDMCEIRA